MQLPFRKKLWPVAPGALLTGFALAAIVLPVGSDGLGATVSEGPGLVPGLGRWARDIHDGFWLARAEVVSFEAVVQRGAEPSYHAPLSTERRRALELCWLGRAQEAVAVYERIGVLLDVDREALNSLGARLIVDADYDLCEWYVARADRLLGGANQRNNLAWHYTQTGVRSQQALDLALGSVAETRTACNVDTLAWAYFAAGEPDRARMVATETLAMDEPFLTPLLREQQELAKQSSQRLLDLIADGRTARDWRRFLVPTPGVPVPTVQVEIR